MSRSEPLVDRFRPRPAPTEFRLFAEPSEQKMVWLVRESALGASRIPRKFETWPSFEDSAVHPSKLGAYLRDFKKVLDRHGYRCVYFGHYGQGCVHCRINFDLRTREGLNTFRHFLEEASDLVLSYGGSLSGEHGDGQAHGHHLVKMFGEDLVEGFREFKSIWDPDWKLNPGKLIDSYPVDSNLRVGPDYRPRKAKTVFSFHEDGGSFAAATERCFGMGKCRKTDSETMCPSFMATLEEKHTTRGRAHLLFEMVRGEVIGQNGWRDDHVKEALDLCLSCKACKGECPVHVDIATYKAEFLSHYYARRLRPRPAYALGLIYWWARLALRAPGFANVLTQTPAPARGEGGRGNRARAAAAELRRPHVRGLVPRARVAERGRPPRSPLAGHVHQPLAAGSGSGRRRGAGGGRLPRRASGSPALLRSAALRLRHADARQAPAPAGPRDAPAPPRRGRCDRRAGARLRRRLPRRASQPLPRG